MDVEITQEMVNAFHRSWIEAPAGPDAEGDRHTRAFLEAAVKALRLSGYHVLPRGRQEGEALDLDAIADKWLQLCPTCDAGIPGTCTHPDEDYRVVLSELVAVCRRLATRATEIPWASRDPGAMPVVAHLLDRLGVSEILISNEDLEREDRRSVSVFQDLMRDGFVIKVIKEPKV